MSAHHDRIGASFDRVSYDLLGGIASAHLALNNEAGALSPSDGCSDNPVGAFFGLSKCVFCSRRGRSPNGRSVTTTLELPP